MWWGYSQALDLLEENSDSSKKKKGGGGDEGETTQNILLIGQCDCRHVLKTIARKYRHKERSAVNFYIYEPLLENVARDLLFLTLALEPPENIGIAHKTLSFMELYGNSLLRPATGKYLTKISKRLLNVVTDFNYAQQILPAVSLDKLKYKERDQLEVIFKYWASDDNSFNVLTAWDERLRKHLGVRYDSRNGVFDWDYHMRYSCYGAETLSLPEYKRFREKGVSFQFMDTDPCVPNNSLASVIFSAGSKILNYGYLGDIITGPYVTFGFECEDEDMLKKVNGKMKKTATDITERNVMRIFHEIEHQTPFIPPSEIESNYSTSILVDETSLLKIQPKVAADSDTKIRIKDECPVYESLNTNNCKIIFMSTFALSDFHNREEYKNFFDLVFISQALIFKHVKPDFFKVVKPNGRVIIDTPKFLLHYRKEDLEKYKNDLIDLMTKSNFKLARPYDSEKDEFAHFAADN